MLNIEQILIKTAQYFDLDLKKLGIKESAEKTRLYKRQLTKETIDHIISKIYQEIDSLEVTPSLKKLVDEFIEYYTYVSEQLYITHNEKLENKLDWLLLKHFVIPFFAVRIAQNFAEYNNRIDKGLPGGDFWYLPSYSESTGQLKIIFPINKVMGWLADLYGGSNQEFYFDKKSDYDKGFSAATLKDWHDNFVTPKLQTIKDFASMEFEYDGVFRNDREVSVEEQFQSAMEFVKSKGLSIEELKLEVPNFNNMLGVCRTPIIQQ